MQTAERYRATQPTLFADPEHERRQAQRMRGQKAVIKIAYGNPDGGVPTYRERDATVYGPLALMPGVAFDHAMGRSRHDGWNITHVATGLAISSRMPRRIEALRAIYLLKDEDWSFARKEELPESLRQRTRQVVEEAYSAAR